MILNGPRWPRLSKTRFAVLGIVGAAFVALTWRAVTTQNAPTAPRDTIRDFKTETKSPEVKPTTAPGPADARLAALLKLEPLKPEPGDDELQRLLKERYNAVLSAFQGYQLQYELRSADVASVCTATHDLFEAELALVSNSGDKTRILERYVEVSKNTWKAVDTKVKAGLGGGTSADEGLAHAATLEAEIKLLRFRAAE